MNALEIFVARNRLNPGWAMNILQGAGMVSDNCISLAEVAEADQKRAVFWLAGIREQVFEKETAEK